MIDLSKEKLQLNYPWNWSNKELEKIKNEIKHAVKEILDNRDYTLKISHTSKKGKFKSFTLELLVHNEDDRKTLYEILSAHDKIKMVL